MTPRKKTSSRGVVLVTIVILVLFSGLFLLAFITSSQTPPVPEETLAADSYMTEVSALLEGADASRGEAVINKYECHACHIQGAGQIAPAFTGLAEYAATHRPPLTAAAYLYESIVNPNVYLVEKEDGSTYPPSMPIDYLARLTKQELGDVIAYLLKQ